VGIIGGTGVGSLLALEPGCAVHVPTTLGTIRGRMIQIENRTAFLMSRHSAGHSIPPHKVNYAGMALALRALGAQICLATAAVGSLNPKMPVGMMAVCSDFLDLSGRNLTLFNHSVIHTPFAQPFGSIARAALLAADADLRNGGTYIGLNGPRFETPHEIRMLAQIGDYVGMTAASEAILMKEAEIQYAVLAIVTNLGEGLGGAVEHGLVGDVMKRYGPKAVEIMKKAVSLIED
jgi:5'-methylthioadenosine phosphorylase